MWPSKKLFEATAKIYDQHVETSTFLPSERVQIGVHYRCGDIAFTKSSTLVGHFALASDICDDHLISSICLVHFITYTFHRPIVSASTIH